MPALAIFFPVPVAVGATAIVHLANNLFKLLIVGRSANKSIVVRFGIPAVMAALLGASLLAYVSSVPVIASYRLGGHVHEITIVKLVIGSLIVFFSCLELVPAFAKISIDRKYMAVGGGPVRVFRRFVRQSRGIALNVSHQGRTKKGRIYWNECCVSGDGRFREADHLWQRPLFRSFDNSRRFRRIGVGGHNLCFCRRFFRKRDTEESDITGRADGGGGDVDPFGYQFKHWFRLERMGMMKTGAIISSNDAETCWNALRYANYSLGQKDKVKVFLIGKGVEYEKASSGKYNTVEQSEKFLAAKGKIYACGTCIKVREQKESQLRPVSTMKDLYDIVKESDRVVTF